MQRVQSFLMLVLIIASCSSPDQPSISDFLEPSPALLELDSTLTSPFFDQGAWFGISLPEKDFGMAAPLMLSDSNGYKFKAPILLGAIKENNALIKNVVNHYFPGSLMQEANSNKSRVTIKTIYIDHQTVLLAYQIKNLSEIDISYNIDWYFPNPDSIINNRLQYDLKNAFLELEFQSAANISASVYQHKLNIIGGEKQVFYLTLRHKFKEQAFRPWNFSKASQELKKNNKRWSKYIEPYQNLPPDKRLLASKCIQTLINNWRTPAGELKYEGLFPSYDYKWFHGFWSWDSWKHAVALVTFEPELAKNQIRTMYHFQDEFGMIADVVYRDTLIENHNWRDTKPPLSGWAIRKVFDQTEDTIFVREMMPRLLKYHTWWYENRDHNGNKLCEYGSTDGTRVAAGWESGMDNAVRFDEAEMIQISKTAWSLNQESVDLNSYLFNEKKHIAYLLDIIGDTETSSSFAKESEVLRHQIQHYFFDEEAGYFFDINTTSGIKLKAMGAEAWTTLWAAIATDEQASVIIDKISDSLHFNTSLPFPTLSASHPKFNPEKGYWRGPVWLDQAYFALQGMKQYGYDDEYMLMKEKLFNNAEGLLQKGRPIRENYDPRNGKGLNANHFSWSAAHVLMLLNDEVK